MAVSGRFRSSSHGPSARSGIEPGDRIVAVEGTRVRNYNHLRSILRANVDLSSQQYTLLRDGRRVKVTVHYASVTPSFLYRHLAFLLVGFTFLLMGLLVFLRRTDTLGRSQTSPATAATQRPCRRYRIRRLPFWAEYP